MKKSKIFPLSFAALLLIFMQVSSFARGGGHGGGHTSGYKSVHVDSYHRHDGTLVSSYYRGAPVSSGGSAWEPSAIYAPVYYYHVPAARTYDPGKAAAEKSEAETRLLKWHQERAENGNAYGQYSMGLRYLKGEGVKRNEELGREWLTKAAKQGHDDAYQTLKNADYFETKRDEHGRTIRSSSARREFMVKTGYPNGRPGYVIDHILALKRGGCDCPENMQWQTIDAARAKDRWE